MIVWFLYLVFVLDHGHAWRQPVWYSTEAACAEQVALVTGRDDAHITSGIETAYCAPMKVSK